MATASTRTGITRIQNFPYDRTYLQAVQVETPGTLTVGGFVRYNDFVGAMQMAAGDMDADVTTVLAALPAAVVRAKGVLALADAPDQRVILQLVGRRWTLEPGAPWGDERPATRLVLIAPHGQVDGAALVATLTGCCRP